MKIKNIDLPEKVSRKPGHKRCGRINKSSVTALRNVLKASIPVRNSGIESLILLL